MSMSTFRKLLLRRLGCSILPFIVGLIIGFCLFFVNVYLSILPVSGNAKLSLCRFHLIGVFGPAERYLETPSTPGSDMRLEQLRFMKAHVTSSSASLTSWRWAHTEIPPELEKTEAAFQGAVHDLIEALESEIQDIEGRKATQEESGDQ